MDKEHINGKMEENMQDHMKKIKNKDLGNITGMMEGFLKDTGKMEREMGMEGLFIQMELLNMEDGSMIKDLMMT